MLNVWNMRASHSDYFTPRDVGDPIVTEIGSIIKLYLNETGTVIDFGCGGGRFTKPLIKVFPRCEIIGIDFSPEMIRLGKKDYEYPEKLICLDASKEELPDCDLLVTHSVLRCIPPKELPQIFVNIVRHSKMMYLIEFDYDEPPPDGGLFFKHDLREFFEKHKLRWESPKQHRFSVFNY